MTDTFDPQTITWRKGEPTDKLRAAPDGAPCTVVREWKDGKGRLQRDTRDGYINGECLTGRFYADFFCSAVGGFTDFGLVSVTVTMPAPEWAEDDYVLVEHKYLDFPQIRTRSEVLSFNANARNSYTVHRLPENMRAILADLTID